MVRLPAAVDGTGPLVPAGACRTGGGLGIMSLMHSSTFLGAALLLAATAPAHAGITGGTTTTATLPLSARYTRGLFGGERDDKWYRVQVRRGEHYAVQAIPIPAGGFSPGYTR